MSNNLLIDREAFTKGYSETLQKEALWPFGGIGKAVDSVGSGLNYLKDNGMNRLGGFVGNQVEKFHEGFRPHLKTMGDKTVGDLADSGLKAINERQPQIQEAAKDTTVSTVRGAGDGIGQIGGEVADWGKNKFNELWNGAASYGKGMLSDPMSTMKNNPWTTGIGAAGILGGGYMLGKGLGMFGGDDNNGPSNGQSNNNFSSNGGMGPNTQPPPMMQSAYVQGYTPRSLSKGGSELPLPMPKMLAGSFTPAIAVGTGIYDAVNGPNLEEPTEPRRINITPEDARANKLMQNPRMREYITSLLRNNAV